MSLVVMTDTSANLPTALSRKLDIGILPFSYYINNVPHHVSDTAEFHGDDFYNMIRAGLVVNTSLIPPQTYTEYFEPVLKEGKDILFVGMSSGISGSLNSARIAAADLMEHYAGRTIEIVDALGASLGEGLHAVRAAKMRDEGYSLAETAEALRVHVQQMFQVFTVDDLGHLRRTGRLSNISAFVGTVLHIKPLLLGSPEGKIVAFAKIRGRKRSIQAMAEHYNRLVIEPEKQIVGIAQAGCRDESLYLESLIRAEKPPMEILNVEYEPVTGSHVGPGALALFFEGVVGVREMV